MKGYVTGGRVWGSRKGLSVAEERLLPGPVQPQSLASAWAPWAAHVSLPSPCLMVRTWRIAFSVEGELLWEGGKERAEGPDPGKVQFFINDHFDFWSQTRSLGGLASVSVSQRVILSDQTERAWRPGTPTVRQPLPCSRPLSLQHRPWGQRASSQGTHIGLGRPAQTPARPPGHCSTAVSALRTATAVGHRI